MTEPTDYEVTKYLLQRSRVAFPTETLGEVLALIHGVALAIYPPHGSGFLAGFPQFVVHRFKRPPIDHNVILLDQFGHLPKLEGCAAILALLEEWKATESCRADVVPRTEASIRQGAFMATDKTLYTPDEIAERGTALYESRIRRLVEANNIDRFLAIDVQSGDYAVGDQRRDAYTAVFEKHPDARIWMIRIGHIAAASLGGGDTREKK